MIEFNHELCEERHEYLKKWCEEADKRMKKVENRFLAMMTTLSLNLIVVIIILVKTFAATSTP